MSLLNINYITHIQYAQTNHEKRIFETVKTNDTNEKKSR